MRMELELIEQDELLDGLLALTGGNLGLSHQLLKPWTEEELKGFKRVNPRKKGEINE